MTILNYTTTIKASKTAGEIQQVLAMAKAQAVLLEFDSVGAVVGMSFRIQTEHGLLTFKLPVRSAGFLKVLRASKVSPKMKTAEHANNVAWRVMKTWVQSQLALVEAGMAELAEVFLPYMQDDQGATMFQRVKQQQFKAIEHRQGGESCT